MGLDTLARRLTIYKLALTSRCVERLVVATHTGHPGKKKKKQLVTVFWTAHFIVFFLTTLFLVKMK